MEQKFSIFGGVLRVHGDVIIGNSSLIGKIHGIGHLKLEPVVIEGWDQSQKFRFEKLR